MWPLPVCLPVCLSNHHKSELCEWNKWIREWSCDYFRNIQHEDTKETSMDVFKLHDDKHAKIGNNNNFIQTAFINVDWHTVIMKASCENTVQTSQNRTLPTHHKVTCWDGSRPDPTWPISTWRVENETQNSSFPTDETFESWTRLDFPLNFSLSSQTICWALHIRNKFVLCEIRITAFCVLLVSNESLSASVFQETTGSGFLPSSSSLNISWGRLRRDCSWIIAMPLFLCWRTEAVSGLCSLSPHGK